MSDLHDEKTTEIKEGKRRRRGESRKGTRKGEKGERKMVDKETSIRRYVGIFGKYPYLVLSW